MMWYVCSCDQLLLETFCNYESIISSGQGCIRKSEQTAGGHAPEHPPAQPSGGALRSPLHPGVGCSGRHPGLCSHGNRLHRHKHQINLKVSREQFYSFTLILPLMLTCRCKITLLIQSTLPKLNPLGLKKKLRLRENLTCVGSKTI